MFEILQAAPAAGGGMSSLAQIAFPLAMIVVMYFFFLRPQMKKQKEQQKFNEGVQKGDKIVTIAGIHATISKLNEDGTIQIETSPGSYLKIEKSAISQEWTKNINKPVVETTKK